MACVLVCSLALYSRFALAKFECHWFGDRFWIVRALPGFLVKEDRNNLVVHGLPLNWRYTDGHVINVDSLPVFIIIVMAEQVWW